VRRKGTDWIPTCAESTPQKRLSHGNKVLGGLRQKGSGGGNDRSDMVSGGN